VTRRPALALAVGRPVAIAGASADIVEVVAACVRSRGLPAPIAVELSALGAAVAGEAVAAAWIDGEPASVAALREAFVGRYIDEPFVHLLPEGVAPATRMVRGSNHCVLNVFADRVPGRAIVIAAIDNLVKGSSGQAIQNFNLMFDLPETTGLEAAPLFP